jgi:AI-2 transport protein TqsA
MDDNKIVEITSGLILVVLLGVILRLAKPVFFPFFLAIFFYFILSPAFDFLTRLRIPRVLALCIIIVVAFIALYLFGILIYTSGKDFASTFPQYSEKMNALIQSVRELFRLTEENFDPWAWSKSLNADRMASLIISSLDKIFSFFSTFTLIFVFLVFMLAGRGKLKVKVEKSFHPTRAKKINHIIDNIDSQVQKYLIIKTGISFISGIIAAVVLFIFGVNFAVVFGFLTFVLNFVPSLGSIIAVAACVLASAFQFGSLWPALWILLILVVIDAFIGNFWEPRLMGKGLGLSPLVVLFSLIFWGWLWGIAGMILAVPLMAVIKIICNNIPALQAYAEMMSG